MRTCPKLCVSAVAVVWLAGCDRSPSFNVLGSYFPGWIACSIAAILTTALLRWGIDRVGLERQIPMLPLFYVCLTLLTACTLWLIAFD